MNTPAEQKLVLKGEFIKVVDPHTKSWGEFFIPPWNPISKEDAVKRLEKHTEHTHVIGLIALTDDYNRPAREAFTIYITAQNDAELAEKITRLEEDYDIELYPGKTPQNLLKNGVYSLYVSIDIADLPKTNDIKAIAAIRGSNDGPDERISIFEQLTAEMNA